MFELQTNYKPTGDQPQAIQKLSNSIKKNQYQTLLELQEVVKHLQWQILLKN